MDLRMKRLLYLRNRACEIDEHAALAHDIHREAFGLKVAGQRRNVRNGRTELRADRLRRKPLVIAGIAGLVQRFHLRVKRGLPLPRALQHKLNMLHSRRRVASTEVLRGRHLPMNGAPRRHQTAAIDSLRDKLSSRRSELGTNRRRNGGLRRNGQPQAPHREQPKHHRTPEPYHPRSPRKTGIGQSRAKAERR